MGKLALFLLDKGIDLALNPAVSWGGPIMGAAIQGWLAHTSGLAPVEVFQKAWIGWLLGCASIVALLSLVIVSRSVSGYWKRKSIEKLEAYRSDLIHRFWNWDGPFDPAIIRERYIPFKEQIASEIRASFGASVAGNFSRIGDISPFYREWFPGHPAMNQIRSMIHRDMGWLTTFIEEFNKEFITPWMRERPRR